MPWGRESFGGLNSQTNLDILEQGARERQHKVEAPSRRLTIFPSSGETPLPFDGFDRPLTGRGGTALGFLLLALFAALGGFVSPAGEIVIVIIAFVFTP